VPHKDLEGADWVAVVHPANLEHRNRPSEGPVAGPEQSSFPVCSQFSTNPESWWVVHWARVAFLSWVRAWARWVRAELVSEDVAVAFVDSMPLTSYWETPSPLQLLLRRTWIGPMTEALNE
jgi:hypothetical protein